VYFDKEERGNRKGARWGKIGGGQGVFGKNAISFLPLESEQRGREAARSWPAGGDSRRAGPRQRPGDGGNGEGFKGIRFPYLPWAEMVCGGGSSGGGGLEVAVLGVAAL
jgi:hypothetical protein